MPLINGFLSGRSVRTHTGRNQPNYGGFARAPHFVRVSVISFHNKMTMHSNFHFHLVHCARQILAMSVCVFCLPVRLLVVAFVGSQATSNCQWAFENDNFDYSEVDDAITSSRAHSLNKMHFKRAIPIKYPPTFGSPIVVLSRLTAVPLPFRATSPSIHLRYRL